MFTGMKNKIAFLLSLFAAGSAFSQTLKFNELMYAPANGEPEWIEFYNVSNDSVNIKDWKIRNKNAKLYLLTSSDFYVSANSYLVVTKSNTIFTFHPSIPSRLLVCPALPTSFMVNTGDTISIHDSTGAFVDSVFYQPSWGGSSGKSLERISLDVSPFLNTNWGTSVDTAGSTPGKTNSIAAKRYDLKITSFNASVILAESKAVFKIGVKNLGTQPASGFLINVFLDYDGDHQPQSGELAASSASTAVLNSGDSTQFVLETSTANAQKLNAFAVVEFSSDEDTTNNSLWTPFKISYPSKSLIVNEIMYAPTSPEPEWVELFNASQDSMDLNGFTLADNSNTKAKLTNTDYIFPPGGYVVVARDSGFFNIHPGITGKVLITAIPSLNNTGDVVAIHDAAGNLIDSVNYSPSWGGNTGGRSLERILAAGSSNDPQNFETSIDSSRSTPARTNSVTPRDYDLALGTIIYSPSSLQSGDSATINANIVNRGLKTSGTAQAILFNDKNGNGAYDTGEFLDSTQVQALNPGDSATVSFNSGALTYGTHRFGIILNYPVDELPLNNTRTLMLSIGLPRASVVINEIMYAPKSSEQEWVEIYNTRDTVVDLSNFKIVAHSGSSKVLSGFLIAPRDFAVICKDSSVSKLHYPVKNLILQSVPSLNNNGDGVGLYDNLGNLLDTMSYVPSYGGANGKSLERVDYFAADDSANWQECVDSTGATPGMINSVAILPYDVALKRINLSLPTMNVGEAENVKLVLQNAGRNAIGNISLSVQIFSGVDKSEVHSETQTLNRTLSPRDSAMAIFTFSPSQSGRYRIAGTIQSSEDMRSRNDTLSTWLNVRYRTQSIVVNEIMYGSGQTGEYFEIFNASQNPIDIGGWTFHSSSTSSKPGHLSTLTKLLMSNEYFVVGGDSAIYNFILDSSCVHLSKSLSLRDDGDCIVIMDPTGIIVDSVYYLPSWHNSDIAQTAGRSLEKINPSLPSNDKTSWSTSVSQTGGTPAKRNSLYIDAGSVTGGITVEPNPFSPDGDGFEDFTFINYSFMVSSVRIRARIFDSIGRLIATPVDNAVLPSSGKLVWDGRDNSGRIVKFGLYILLVEVTGPDGKSLTTYQKPLVVAKKMR